MSLSSNLPTKQHKVTAEEVAKPPIDDAAAKDVALLGSNIRAHLKLMRSYEAEARKKADVPLRKAQNNYDTIIRLLAEAKAKCDRAGFRKFRVKYCPDLGRSRLCDLLQIGTGKKTLEQVKAESRGRKAKQRAKDRRELSVTTAIVTDESAAPAKSAEVELADPEATTEPAPIAEPEAPPPRPTAPIEVVPIEPVGAELGSIVESDWATAERAFEALTSHTVAQVAQTIPPGRVALVAEIAGYFTRAYGSLYRRQRRRRRTGPPDPCRSQRSRLSQARRCSNMSSTTPNPDPLLRLLEANIARAREPELIARLRAAIDQIQQNSRGIATDRGNENGAVPGAGLDHGR